MANQKLYVKDIMTVEVVTVRPEDSVVYAARLLYEYNFSGLPVVDKDGLVAGIVTEYDLISKGDALHLPTLINILGNVDTYKKDNSLIKDDLKMMMILKVEDVMNEDPLTVEEDAPIQLLTELFSHHHRVNPIPVVDKSKKLKGVVSRFDVVKFFMDKDMGREVPATSPAALDKKVENFIDNFDKKFAAISRVHAKWWPFLSFLLAILSFTLIFIILFKLAPK